MCALKIGADSSVPVHGQPGAFAPTTRKMPIPKRAKIVEIFEKPKKNLAPEPSSEILRGGSKCQFFFGKCPKTVVRDPFDSGGVRGAPPMLRHHSSIFVHFGCPSSIPFLRLQRWGKQRRACFQNGKFCCLTCFKVLRAQL